MKSIKEKAKEAPERIWIDNLDEGFWFDSPSGNKSIEYIRKDAFIERAAEWLDYFYNEDTNSYLIDEDIESFIDYMEGE